MDKDNTCPQSDLENPKKAVFRILPLFLLTITLCLAVIFLPKTEPVSQIEAEESEESLLVPFKVSFEGVDVLFPDQTLEVLVRKIKTGETQKFTKVPLFFENNGLYSGSVLISGVSFLEEIDLFLKGPKHLAKKYSFEDDFPSILLLVGDLPDPNQKNTQDGVADSLDFSLVKSRLGKNDTKSLEIADLNFDLLVDQTDLDLVSQAVKDQLVDEN